MKKHLLSCLALSLFMLTGLFSQAQSLPTPVSTTYISIEGDTLDLLAWEGEEIVFLTESDTLDPAVMAEILATLDSAYNYYAAVVGQEPSLFFNYNGKPTFAQVPSTCGAGCGYIGFTGIEVLDGFFDILYDSVRVNNTYDQVPFFELGRNFFVFGNKAYSDFGDTYSSALRTAFAIFMRYESMIATGVNEASFRNQPFEVLVEDNTVMIDLYLADNSLTFDNTIALNVAGVTSPVLGLNGSADLLSSFLLRLKRDYGGDTFVNNIWKELLKRPDAANRQDGIDNFIIASSIAANQNLVPQFQEWRWPVSDEAIAELESIYGPGQKPVPTQYISFVTGDTLDLFAWIGNDVALLTVTDTLNPETVEIFLNIQDSVFRFYKRIFGRTPSLNINLNGKATFSEVPGTCSPSCTFLGSTGIEWTSQTFNKNYDSLNINLKFNPDPFFLLARNYYFFANKLYADSGSDYAESAFGGYRIFNFYESVLATEANTTTVRNTFTFEELLSENIKLIDLYLNNDTLAFENTLAVGSAGVTGDVIGLNGGSDLFASFLLRLKRDYGGDIFVNNIWKELLKRPDAANRQDGIDNFIIASSIAANQNLVPQFQEWRWPVSQEAMDELDELFPPVEDPCIDNSPVLSAITSDAECEPESVPKGEVFISIEGGQGPYSLSVNGADTLLILPDTFVFQELIKLSTTGSITSSDEFLFWNQNDTLFRADLDGSNVIPIILYQDTLSRISNPFSFNEKIYWINNDKVSSADLDGKNIDTLISGFKLMDIYIANNLIYFLEEAPGNETDIGYAIFQAQLDGSDINELFRKGPGNSTVGDIAVSQTNIYWKEGFNFPLSTDLDGNNLQELTYVSAGPDIDLFIKGNILYLISLFPMGGTTTLFAIELNRNIQRALFTFPMFDFINGTTITGDDLYVRNAGGFIKKTRIVRDTLTLTNFDPGTYQLEIFDINGCTDDTTLILNEPAIPTTTCTLDNWLSDSGDPLNHAVYLFHSPLDPDLEQGNDTEFQRFTWVTKGTQTIIRDTLAIFTGLVQSTVDPDAQFDVFIELKDPNSWSEWEQAGGTFNIPPNPEQAEVAKSNFMDWKYWALGENSRLEGRGALEGTLFLTQAPDPEKTPAGERKRVQVGHGANDKDVSEGVSGWFFFEGDITYKGNRISLKSQGDINADITSCVEECGEPEIDPFVVGFEVVSNAAGEVSLTWGTMVEGTGGWFMVERSVDGKLFESILSKECKDGKIDPQIHHLIDEIMVSEDPIYYRLKIVDNEGNVTYSALKTVTLNDDITVSVIVYPNPVEDQLTIQILPYQTQAYQLELIDMMGIRHLSQSASFAQGRHSLDMSKLPTGNYILMLTDTQGNRTPSFITVK